MLHTFNFTKKSILLIILLMIIPAFNYSQKQKLDSLLRIYHSDSINATSDLLNSIGGEYYIRYDMDGYNTALKFHQHALDAAKRDKDKKMIAVSYRLIAAVYDAINMNLDTAAAYYNNYLDYVLSVKDTARIIDGYRNLLVIDFKLKNEDARMEAANKLYTYLKTYTGEDNANYKNLLSIVYSQKRILSRAKELFTKIDVDLSAEENPENFRNYYYAGHFLFQAEEKYADGARFLNDMLGKAKLTIDSISITKFLSEHYEDMGDYKNAFLSLEQNSAMANKYTNDAGRNKIAETASFYENAQKEKERIFFKEKAESESKIKNYSIIMLVLLALVVMIFAYFSARTKRQNAELKNQKNELHKLNDEKTLYLKEIHHRVKNNLQIISSMLDLQIRDIQDAKTKDALKEMQMRVYSMAIVHKSLYERDDLNQINLQFYFENLFTTIYSTFNLPDKKITFFPQTHNLSFNIDYVIPLGLIVNELATNSLKYGFGERTTGEITLEIRETEKNVFAFLYSDNGHGLQMDVDIDKTNSFGLKLVKLMTKKLKSTLNFENDAGGLRFFFNFRTQE